MKACLLILLQVVSSSKNSPSIQFDAEMLKFDSVCKLHLNINEILSLNQFLYILEVKNDQSKERSKFLLNMLYRNSETKN